MRRYKIKREFGPVLKIISNTNKVNNLDQIVDCEELPKSD